MWSLNRRQFLGAGAALALRGAETPRTRVALVSSSHPKLARPSSPEDPLDYPRVRDMVWKAIRYALSLSATAFAGSFLAHLLLPGLSLRRWYVTNSLSGAGGIGIASFFMIYFRWGCFRDRKPD